MSYLKTANYRRMTDEYQTILERRCYGETNSLAKIAVGLKRIGT